MKRQSFTVLVADDNEDDQAFIGMAFKKANPKIKIRLVSSGSEAIEYLEGKGEFGDRQRFEYPSFILTDLKMPRGDGFSVLEFLRSTPDFAIIPTVVLSGSGDLDDIKKAHMLGASAYLIKPTEFTELMEMIRVLLAFWMKCEAPEVDVSGKMVKTVSGGKLGERFNQ